MQTYGGLINLPNHLPSWLFPECVQGIIFPLELSLFLFLFSRARSSFSTSPFCSGYIFSSPLLAQLAVQGRNLLETSFLSTSSPLRLPFNLFLRPVPAPSFSKFKAFLHFLNALCQHFFLVYQRVFFRQSFIPFPSLFSIHLHRVSFLSKSCLTDSSAVFLIPYSFFSSSVAPTVKLFCFPPTLRFENFIPLLEFFFIFSPCFSFFLIFKFLTLVIFSSWVLLLLMLGCKFVLLFVSYFLNKANFLFMSFSVVFFPSRSASFLSLSFSSSSRRFLLEVIPSRNLQSHLVIQLSEVEKDEYPFPLLRALSIVHVQSSWQIIVR